jgi:hypothetical protein
VTPPQSIARDIARDCLSSNVPTEDFTNIMNVFVLTHSGECAICFDRMCQRPSAVLHNAQNHRACFHFCHQECVRGFTSCPVCAVPFTSTVSLPDYDLDPKAFFKTVRLFSTFFKGTSNCSPLQSLKSCPLF